MNREIKFRAWNKITSEWMQAGQSLLGHIIAWETDERFVLLGRGDFEIVQYTGLKDKNGKEIYEGDIVQIIDDPVFGEEESIQGVIKLYECAFWIENEQERKAYPLFHEISERHVIGNIYDNPDLLEKVN